MEKSKHLAKVASTDHSREVIDFSILEEKIKKVLHLLKWIIRCKTCLFVALNDALYHLTSISASRSLLELLDDLFVVVSLVSDSLDLVDHDVVQGRPNHCVTDRLALAPFRTHHFLELAADYFSKVLVIFKFFIDQSVKHLPVNETYIGTLLECLQKMHLK